MRRVLDIRIVRWELKLAYVVGAYLLGFAIATTLRAVHVVEPLVLLLSSCVDVVAILLGARVFRGRGEAVEPPRSWWRMTARPKLSWVIGVVALVISAWTAVGLALDAFGIEGIMAAGADYAASAVAGVLEFGVIAALYLNSAIRLKRLGVPAPEPKFRPTIRVKP